MLLIRFQELFIYADKEKTLATKLGFPTKISPEIEQKVQELLELLAKPEKKKPHLFKIDKKYKPLLQGLMEFDGDSVIYNGIKGFFTEKGIIFDRKVNTEEIFEWLSENYNINLKKDGGIL